MKKFNKLKFKCAYYAYDHKFHFWCENCKTIKERTYEYLRRGGAGVVFDVITDLKSEYCILDRDEKEIKSKVLQALYEICPDVYERN